MSTGRLAVVALLVVLGVGAGVVALTQASGFGAEAEEEEIVLRAPDGDDERDAVDAVARYAALGRRDDRRGACALLDGEARREQSCDTNARRPGLLTRPRAPVRWLRVPEGTDAGDGRVEVWVHQAPERPGTSALSIVELSRRGDAWRIVRVGAGVAFA